MRLDSWLARHHPEKSRQFWQVKIKSGEVRVNRRKVKASHNVRTEDDVQIHIKEAKPLLKPEKIPLDILFEDKNYLIINKPAGLVVHPGAGNPEHTLVNALVAKYGKKLSSQGGSERPGIVHRLDKDTSGLLVVAKNDAAHAALSEQFKKKKVEKKYIALVDGHLSPHRGMIEAPLSRNISQRQKITVTSRSGSRNAVSHYEVKKSFSHPLPASLLEVRIETGRTHQIRVHLEAIGHPILGDNIYGRRRSNQVVGELGLQRQFLHAGELSFVSPTTQKKETYTVPLPKELSDLLKLFY